jgi:hygromycin-B 7''-O-kinase
MILPVILTDSEYENIKRNTALFENAVREIIACHQLPETSFSRCEGSNIVFALESGTIIKIFPAFHKSQFESEVRVMKHLYNKLSVSTPAVKFEGELAGWPYIIMTQLEGTLLEGLWDKLDSANKIIILRELGALIREVHSLSVQGLEVIDCHWPVFIRHQINQCYKRHQATELSDKLLQQIPKYLSFTEEILPEIKHPVILTGEYTPMNLLVTQESVNWHINGLIDFGDAMLGLPEYDLLGPGVFLIQGDKLFLKEFLLAYGYLEEELTQKLSRQLTLLLLLHRYSNLNLQIRIENWHQKVERLEDLENLVWPFSSISS